MGKHEKKMNLKIDKIMEKPRSERIKNFKTCNP